MLADTPDAYLRLHPWHQPIVRRPGEAQFGLAPDDAIITGLTDVELELVRCLDGTQSLLASYREAHDAGVAPARWRELIDLLAELGVVERVPHGRGATLPTAAPTTHPPRTASPSRPSPIAAGVLARPESPGDRNNPGHETCGGSPSLDAAYGASVIVEGSGALADHIAALLGESVPVVPRPGGPRHGRDTTGRSPALVVLVGSPALDPRAGDPWLMNGTAHLPITVAGPRTTVGPLVSGPCGPCLWCLDLHRADRDDAWPTIMAQLCSDPAGAAGTTGGTGPLATAAVHLTVGSVTAFVHSVLTGNRPPAGISLDLWVPWPRIDYRRWEVHPQCPRHRGCPGHRHGRPTDGESFAVAGASPADPTRLGAGV